LLLRCSISIFIPIFINDKNAAKPLAINATLNYILHPSIDLHNTDVAINQFAERSRLLVLAIDLHDED
jgi:hypothetical protein